MVSYVATRNGQGTRKPYYMKFSRKELQELCEEGVNQVTSSFKISDETIELSNLISAIHEEDVETYMTNQGKDKAKSNNEKAKGKNKNK